jgi:hypothetical protein
MYWQLPNRVFSIVWECPGDRCYDFKKIVSPKNWRFLLELLLVFFQKFDHSIGFLEKRQFFSPDENCRKSQKIVIITRATTWVFEKIAQNIAQNAYKISA